MNRRAFLSKALPLAALILVGIVILVAGGHDDTTIIIGSSIEGLAAIFLTSLFFYEVGRSEERAREAEREQRPS